MDGIHSVHGAWLIPPPAAPAAFGKEQTPTASHPAQEPEMRKVLDDLKILGNLFHTRLEYRFNEAINQVVIKVYDEATDTLIKELPSAELQAIYLRLREVLGLAVRQ